MMKINLSIAYRVSTNTGEKELDDSAGDTS